MVKVNIISGFLGAGKTTFIKRLISDVFKGEKLVLIENEFGEIGVDGGFLQDAGIEITEMNSGCICCSLVGDFTKALEETVKKFEPDRIIIEPSGVGKLSDVIAAVNNTSDEGIKADVSITVADATKCKMYIKNFGEFYKDQIEHSNCMLLTRTDKASAEKIEQAVNMIREINGEANIITTHLDSLSRESILEAFESDSFEEELLNETKHSHHHHHEHHHDHDEHCECGCHDHEHHEHHHDHDEHCDCGCHDHEHHEHHHHDHDEHCECGCHDHEHHEHHHDHDEHCECGCHDHDHHEHHHDHDEHCDCGCHDHEHHEHHEHHHDHDEHCTCGCHDHEHHHHADETFTSWGFETARKYSEEEIKNILSALDSGDYGVVLRAKGMVASDNDWIYFDYVPEEHSVRSGAACFTGKICVIGAELNEAKLEKLFSKNN